MQLVFHVAEIVVIYLRRLLHRQQHERVNPHFMQQIFMAIIIGQGLSKVQKRFFFRLHYKII